MVYDMPTFTSAPHDHYNGLCSALSILIYQGSYLILLYYIFFKMFISYAVYPCYVCFVWSKVVSV